MIIGYLYVTPKKIFEVIEEKSIKLELRVEETKKFPVFAKMKIGENNKILYDDENFQDQVTVLIETKIAGVYHPENEKYIEGLGKTKELIKTYTQQELIEMKNKKDEEIYVEFLEDMVAVNENVLAGKKHIARIRNNEDSLRNEYYKKYKEKFKEEVFYEYKIVDSLNQNNIKCKGLAYITKKEPEKYGNRFPHYEVKKITERNYINDETLKTFYINEKTTEEQAAKEALEFFNSLE